MVSSVTLMSSSSGEYELTGQPSKADGWFGFSDGLHTVSIHAVNLKGRVYIEGSLEKNPTENDWFPIWLEEKTPYIQFPQIAANPSGANGGDTDVVSFTFTANLLWIRARLYRSYLPDPHATEDDIAVLGMVKKVILSR